MFLSVKEEAAGLLQAPHLFRPPSLQLRIGAGGTGGSQPALGGCAACGPHPQLCPFASGTERILPWMGWMGPMAAALGSQPAWGPVLPARWGVGRPVGTGMADLVALARVSLGKPPPSPGTGRLARTGGRGMSPRLPEESCTPYPACSPFPREPPLVSSGVPDPRSADVASWRLSCSCGPTRGPCRASQANTLVGFWGGCWTVTCGTGRPLCCTPLPPAPSRRERGGRGSPAHPGPCRGLREGKGRAVSPRSGAAPRRGWAVPTCAPGQAPAARRADESPVWRTPLPSLLFPLTCPKSASQRNPPAPNVPGLPAPRRAPLPAGEALRPLRGLLLRTYSSSNWQQALFLF